MIRLWLSRAASTPVREQLSAQLVLGILSRKLPAGSRLPSVRDLARRLAIHPNTVSTVYRDLAARGWVTAKHGSGVFVNDGQLIGRDGGIEAFVRAWVAEAQALGYSTHDLQTALEKLNQPAGEMLVIDPDQELARILAAEISEAVGYAVRSAGIDDAATSLGMRVLVNEGNRKRVAEALPKTALHSIRLKSMPEMLSGMRRPAQPVLVVVVSRSESVLRWASTLASALGFEEDSVLFRNPRNDGWGDGLGACGIVAADVIAAADLPPNARSVVFRLISEESIAEVRSIVTAKKVS